ncbi:MAG: hypothetical protein GPOALKHO_000271 [Sodalis sp.]|uniref:hypothetical protein n=1 Tax=Sodalis sp. (in: enterobacteria) TaxID=1898979 RepID=UPI0038735A63|nr:MAG: hypothetical protein GPOALKHO_000271 [Sodalis sp.]
MIDAFAYSQLIINGALVTLKLAAQLRFTVGGDRSFIDVDKLSYSRLLTDCFEDHTTLIAACLIWCSGLCFAP